MVRRLLVPLAVSLLVACGGGGGTAVVTTPILATSFSPAVGASDVPRDVVVHLEFDTDLDPASCTTANCYLQRLNGGVVVPTAVAWDAAQRRVTIDPVAPLEPDTIYLVVVTPAVRTLGGANVSGASWTFRTADDPAWSGSLELAPGRLIASASSRVGGALAVWRTPEGLLSFARYQGGAWFDTASLGLSNVREAAVADDRDGAAVVLAATLPADPTSLWLVRHRGEGQFWPPEPLASGVFDHTAIDHDGGLLVVAARRLATSGVPEATWMRAWSLGLGWTEPQTTPPSHAQVRVDGIGHGVVLHGRNWLQPFNQYTPWCERTCFGLGTPGTFCDVGGLTPDGPTYGSKVRWLAGSLLTTQSVAGTSPLQLHVPVTRVLTWGMFEGWELHDVELAVEPDAHDIALVEGYAALASIEEGQPPRIWTRDPSGFAEEAFGVAGQPAPIAPAIAVAITADLVRTVVWTAHESTAPGAPVRLLARSRTFNGAWQPPTVIDGPFVGEDVRNLRIVATGPLSVVALWDRGGRVRYSELH